MFNMLSDCEDDLCIFVCGTCKRYFTQLSAFAQHKKEKLCKKSSGLQGKLFANNFVTSNRAPERNVEEADSEYADMSMDSQDYHEYSNDQLRNDEENDYNSQKRKYPRKQDKTKIKRTVRELESESQGLYHEALGASQDGDGLQETGARHHDLPGNGASTLPPQNQLGLTNLFGKPTQEPTFCRHLVYICKACHKEFSNNLSKPYRCCDCRRGFQTERELRVHVMRAKHNNLCDVCGKIFPDKYKLRKHSLSHVTEKNFPCDYPGCTKAFKSAEDVRTHMKYVHATEKPFKCLQCLRAFARPDKYKQHLLTHRHHDISESMHTVANGGVESPGNSALALGQFNPGIREESRPSVVNMPENYEPHYPGQHTNLALANAESFPEESNGNDESIRKVTSDRTQPATEPETVTKVSTTGEPEPTTKTHDSEDDDDDDVDQDVRALVANEATQGVESGEPHEMRNSSDEGTGRQDVVMPKYECQNCGLRFDDVETLDQHVITHVDVAGGEQCERCHGNFRNADEVFAHEERRPDHVLRCEQCSSKFVSVCDLYVHGRQAHNALSEQEAGVPEDWRATRVAKQQKHVCGECGKGFTRADKLRRHAIIHSPDRPCMQCPCRESHGCPLTFYRKDSLKRHTLTHSLQKPFKCNMCDKTFSRQDYITRHVTQMHKQTQLYNCTLCEYGTHEARRLKIHIRSRHELEPDTLMAVENEIDITAPSEGPTDVAPTEDDTSEKISPGGTPQGYGERGEEDEFNDSDPIDLTEAGKNCQSSGVTSGSIGNSSEHVVTKSESIDIRQENVGVASKDIDVKSENIGMLSANPGMMAGGVVRKAGTIREFRETVYEAGNQIVNPHFGFMGASSAMSRQHPGFVYGHNAGMMSNNEVQHSYGQHQMHRSEHKSPLNSVTVAAHQPGAYSAGYLGNTPHNMYP